MRLVHVYIPGVGHLGSSRHCDGADDLNGISDNLWSGVSRIVGITSGAVVYVKTEPWDQDDIINGTTACYAVTGEIRLGKSHLNDQIKKAHIKCGSVTVSKVSATLLEHDVTSDSSQGDGEKKTLLRVCGHQFCKIYCKFCVTIWHAVF